MSTRGVAHHQRGTFPMIDTDAEMAARKARYSAKDAAYRAALRLGADEPLPSRLGVTSSSGGHFNPTHGGGRLRRSGSVQL